MSNFVKITPAQEKRLATFLTAPQRPPGTFGIQETRGFIWGIASAPTSIEAEEWLPLVFDDQYPNFRNDQEADSITEILLLLCDTTFEQIERDIPPWQDSGEVWRDDSAHRQALAEWCSGLLKAHYWLEEDWHDAIACVKPVVTEDGTFDISEEVESALDIISLFADADGTIAESDDPDELRNSMPEIAEHLPWVALNYARCGQVLYEHLDEVDERSTVRRLEPKIGRNDPCFCGSGKKYKHCCINAANDE